MPVVRTKHAQPLDLSASVDLDELEGLLEWTKSVAQQYPTILYGPLFCQRACAPVVSFHAATCDIIRRVHLFEPAPEPV
jgi:hypothetical protein